MATWDSTAALREEATCSICADFYTEPVTIDCGHNFCHRCLNRYMSSECLAIACPECKQKFNHNNLRPNKGLAKIVGHIKHLEIQSGEQCEQHGQKRHFFCETEGTTICGSCWAGTEHKTHREKLNEEVVPEYKDKLQDHLLPLKKQMEAFLKWKSKEEEKYGIMRRNLDAERLKIESEFNRLHKLLKCEEGILHKRIWEMYKKIARVEKANTTKLLDEISSLDSLIKEIEKKCEQPAEELLKDIRRTLSRCENVTFRTSEGIRKKKKDPVNSDHHTEKDPLRIILVGKVGSGKSATGNSILGRKEFQDKVSPTPVTKDCKEGTCEFKGQSITVVDTPGVFDTDSRSNERILRKIAQCVGPTCPGLHSIIVVISGGRFTEEEVCAAEIVQDLFGREALKYMIVLFTRKEDLENRLEDHVAQSDGKLKDLITTCGGRYCGFNNKATGEEQEVQISELLALIEGMVQENGRGVYTHAMYAEAQKGRKEEMTRKILEDKEREENKRLHDVKEEFQRIKKEKGHITQNELEDVQQHDDSKMAKLLKINDDKLKDVHKGVEYLRF